MNKICIQCRQDFNARRNTARFCQDCLKIRHNDYHSNYRKSQPKCNHEWVTDSETTHHVSKKCIHCKNTKRYAVSGTYMRIKNTTLFAYNTIDNADLSTLDRMLKEFYTDMESNKRSQNGNQWHKEMIAKITNKINEFKECY